MAGLNVRNVVAFREAMYVHKYTYSSVLISGTQGFI